GVGTPAALSGKGFTGLAFSSFNIHHAISLLVAGAKEPSQFLSPLYANVSYPDFITGMNFLLKSIQNSGANVSLASSVWMRQPIVITPEFQSTVTNELFGTTASVPMLNATDINDWVSKATYGKIPQIVDQSVAQSDGALVSALYFKDTWATAFDQSDMDGFATLPTTATPSFTARETYMNVYTDLAYVITDAYTAARVPFRHGFDAYYVMSADSSTSATPADFIDAPSLAYLAGPLSFTPFTSTQAQDAPLAAGASLPKTSTPTVVRMKLIVPSAIILQSSFDLKTMWGSNIPANTSIKYNVLTKPFGWLNETLPFEVTRAVHVTTLEVDRIGVEASAATAIIVDAVSAKIPPAGLPELKFNKPFLFHLVHRDTNVVFFSAVYAGPSNPVPYNQSASATSSGSFTTVAPSAAPTDKVGKAGGAGRIGNGHMAMLLSTLAV
ncbi:hypothetical protein HDU93_004034, partial [Gonapodya sp. JEL0774]